MPSVKAQQPPPISSDQTLHHIMPHQFAAVPSQFDSQRFPVQVKCVEKPSTCRVYFTRSCGCTMRHVAPCCAMLRHAPSNAAGKLCSPHDLQATSDTPPGTA